MIESTESNNIEEGEYCIKIIKINMTKSKECV